MLTRINLQRMELITKEKMESYCKRKEYERCRKVYGENYMKDSVNDDLESLFENIRLGRESDEFVETYFLPKLTEEELELVERRDTNYLQTFFDGRFQRKLDVDETEMMLSESDSKYFYGNSTRKTIVIENTFINSLKNKCSIQ